MTNTVTVEESGNPAVTALAGDGQGNQPDPVAKPAPWYGDIQNAEVKTWAENKNFSDIETSFKSHRALEQVMGGRIAPPKDGEPFEAWEGWDKLGVPKEAKAYADVVKVPELPEGMAIDEELMNKAYDIGAQKRIPAAHLQEMVNLFAESEKAKFAAQKTIDETDRKELDGLYLQWGTEKDQRLEQARRAVKALGMDDALIQEASFVKGSAHLVSKLAEIGRAMGEGSFVQFGANGMTPEKAKAEIAAMKADPVAVEALSNPNHASHQAMKKKWSDLQMIRNSE